MDLVQRAKNICLTPNTEWSVIADDTTSTGTLVTGYVVPLAAVGAVAGLIGGSLVGYSVPFVGTYRTPIVAGLVAAVFGLVMAVVGILIISFIINALAPTFGAQQNSGQALKVAVYSFTPAWVAGVLRIVPALGLLGVLAALYGIYLLYLGLPRLMKCPPEKAMPYTAVSVVSAFIVMLVVGAVVGLVGGVGMMGAGMLGGASRPPAAAAQFDPDSPLGKLQALSNKLEESGKKMDEAQKSGNAKDQAAAAAETIGTLLGGGSRVEPVEIGQLKPLLPETFGGLARQSSSAEKNGIAGLMVSKAEAEYGDGAGKRIHLEISDTGGVSGLMSFASWAAVQNEKDDQYETEKTEKVDGRLVHEKVSKTGGSNEYGIVLGDRFVVNAQGDGVDINALKAAVSGLDLGKIESMKNVGVQK